MTATPGLAALKDRLQCRDEQIDLLAGLIGQASCPLPPLLYIDGHSGSGKSTVLEAVLRECSVLCCAANCVELYTPSLLYRTVLDTLTGWTPNASNGYSSYASCETLGEFVLQLQLLAGNQCKGRRLALVLYSCERLRDADANFLPALCRLQELCGPDCNLTVVLVSTLPVDRVLPSSGIATPLCIHFPQYDKEELLTLLLRDRCPPSGEAENGVTPADQERGVDSEEFHRTFISLVLNVFAPATRNITEMSHLVSVHWPLYVAPVLRDEISPRDVRRLWRNIEPHLRRALGTVFLREVTSTQYEEMQRLAEHSSNTLPSVQTIAEGTGKVELPYYSKYLLISAYLASYNPARTDRRYFTKHHGKQKKTLAGIKAKERSCSQLTGPKQFPLDRLLAIFYSISDCKMAPTAALFTQLSTLVTLRLLVQCGGVDTLGEPKYKCVVGLQFIRTIARTVDFDIVHYLYDFA